MIAQILRIVCIGSWFLSCLVFHAFSKPLDIPPTFQSSFSFLENKGQITDQYGQQRGDIDFKISAGGVNVFVGEGAIRYQWARPADTPLLAAAARVSGPALSGPDPISVTWDMYRMDVELVGANRDALLIKENKLDYYERYYLPQCGPEGATAFSYEKLTYKNVYPYIDWVLYVKDGHMKYDFVVHPGGKVSDIRLRYGGAASVKPIASGEVLATTPFGSVTEKAPVSFQDDGRAVASRFVLADQTLSFSVAPYKGTLTIDPELEWGTYYGGYASVFEATHDVEYDKFHDDGVYICGMTMTATNIATTGAYQTSFAGLADAFLGKFNHDGERLWGTYFGGPMTDGQNARMVCDTFGNIYMTAITSSAANISTPGSHQSLYGGDGDNFLVKFDPTGARQWATYYGGAGAENWPDLATDGANIYLLSGTESDAGIATPGSYKDSRSGSDIYLAKFNGAGLRQWATYYGGSGYEMAGGIVCDKPGNVYFSGTTSSGTEIATSSSYQSVYGGESDAFIVKFDENGARQWATYYGGTGSDEGTAIAVDDSCNVYVGGRTQSSNGLFTASGHQTALGGKADAFLVKWDSAGNPIWGTYYGGSEDEGFDIRVSMGPGTVHLAGNTLSQNGIATANAYQNSNMAPGTIYGNVFLAEFDESSGTRNWGTFYGGAGGELAGGMANDYQGNVYIGGATLSATGIATPGSFNDTFRAILAEPFLAKFCVGAELAASRTPAGPDSLCANTEAVYSIEEIEDVTAYIWTLPSGWSGSSDSNSIEVGGVGAGGVLGVQIVRCGDTSAMVTLEVNVFPPDPAVITIDGFVLGTVKTTYTSYQWLYNDSLIPGATGRTHTVTANGDYRVITTNSSGCADTSAVYTVKNYTGISDKELRSRIKVFPNPAQAEVRIQSPVPVNVRLSSMEGRSLLRKDNAQSIDLGELAPGVYILHIEDRNGRLLKAEQLVKGAE